MTISSGLNRIIQSGAVQFEATNRLMGQSGPIDDKHEMGARSQDWIQNKTTQMKNTLHRIARPGGISLQGSIPQFAPNWCFFLDLDGTLVDIAEQPEFVHIDASLHELLQRLMVVTGGAVALISGRSIVDMDRLFSPVRLPVAGQHGLERRDTLGAVHVFECNTERVREAAKGLERLVAQYSELKLEKKGMTLAMHYRRGPELASRVASAMDQALCTLGDGFELLLGKMVFEIKPRGKDKGTATSEFMQEEPFNARVPVYIGDDATDESGFMLVNTMCGHSVKVGDGITRARWRLADATAVRRWLMAFVDRYWSSSNMKRL